MKKIRKLLQAVSLTAVLALTGCTSISARVPSNKPHIVSKAKDSEVKPTPAAQADISFSDIPAYAGNPYVVMHNNIPYFLESDLTTDSYESYSALDHLGRCGPAVASIGKDLMPTKKRESIGMIKPSGWHTIKYDNVEGKYLYNRSHLIGYQLTAENANERNLITGTRYMNAEGMEPFESMTADYIKETNHHVLYRVTPLFQGNNLVASGVLMEAESVEDKGKGIEFCIYCYNVQPGITIDYRNGNSVLDSSLSRPPEKTVQSESNKKASSDKIYTGNRNSKVFHHFWCTSVKKMKDSNKVTFESRNEAIAEGYEPCKQCNP